MIFRTRAKSRAAQAQQPEKVPDVSEYRMDSQPLEPLSPSEFDAIVREIDELTERNRSARDPETERRLLLLRHRAGSSLVASGGERPPQPEPAATMPLINSNGSRIPEIEAKDLTPEVLRGGIVGSGSLLVRGLVDPGTATELAGGIEAAFDERVNGRRDPERPYYEEFQPEPPFQPLGERPWIQEGGGVLAVDSPRLMFDVVEAFGRIDMPGLIRGYLGEPAALSANKSTLRKAEPTVPGAWHQDGSFLGDVRALNVWLALSRCGDRAPGLDVVARRLDDFVPTGTEGTYLGFQVSEAVANEAAGDAGIERPIFEPGDALLFDELCLHQTASDPSMPDPRYAIEAWFFGPSAFPPGYVPLAY